MDRKQALEVLRKYWTPGSWDAWCSEKEKAERAEQRKALCVLLPELKPYLESSEAVA